MAKKSDLPLACDWRNRNIADWNTATYRAYLTDSHFERFSIPYVSRSIKMEAGMLSQAIKQYGKDAVKAFIDECIRSYTPTPQYPGINFAFMYSYMREQIMPKVLVELHRKKRLAGQTVNGGMSDEEIENWL